MQPLENRMLEWYCQDDLEAMRLAVALEQLCWDIFAERWDLEEWFYPMSEKYLPGENEAGMF